MTKTSSSSSLSHSRICSGINCEAACFLPEETFSCAWTNLPKNFEEFTAECANTNEALNSKDHKGDDNN